MDQDSTHQENEAHFEISPETEEGKALREYEARLKGMLSELLEWLLAEDARGSVWVKAKVCLWFFHPGYSHLNQRQFAEQFGHGFSKEYFNRMVCSFRDHFRWRDRRLYSAGARETYRLSMAIRMTNVLSNGEVKSSEQLIKEAKEAHESCVKAARDSILSLVQHIVWRADAGRAFRQLKDMNRHGSFHRLLARRCPWIEIRTAQNYMKFERDIWPDVKEIWADISQRMKAKSISQSELLERAKLMIQVCRSNKEVAAQLDSPVTTREDAISILLGLARRARTFSNISFDPSALTKDQVEEIKAALLPIVNVYMSL